MPLDVEWIWFFYDQGFSIIPLGKRKKEPNNGHLKKPSITTWDTYKTERATKEQIQQWIDEDLFKNIGIVCGHVSNDLVIIDIDDETIPETIGLKLDKILETGAWIVKTGKGYQIYMKHHSNPGNIQKPIKYKIEYRANNGYCVAPPSIHPNGKQYQFLYIKDKKELPNLIDKDVKSIFKDFKKQIGEAWNIQEKKHVYHGTTKTDETNGYPRCIEIALNTITKHPMRYSTIYGIASSFSLQNIPIDMAVKRIKQFNMEKCTPPKSNDDIENAIKGAYDKNSKKYGCEFWMDDAELCPYENIMECPWGKKKAKRELKKQYQIFKYTEKENKKTGEKYLVPTQVIAPRLAKLIMEEYDYNFKTIRDNQEMYYYNDGHYHPDGETIIATLSTEYMEDLTTTHMKNEVINYIKDINYIERDIFDADTKYINLKNGIFNLETKQLEPHNPNRYFLNEIPVKYDPDKDCPKIKKFFSEVIYEEDISTLQEFFGYVLYRKYLIHKICMFIGDGKNGKSTAIRLLEAFIGKENVKSRELQRIIEDKFAVADLYGKLANVCADIQSTAFKETGILKALTGEDLVTAEKKFKGAFDFRNYAKFIFSANKLPKSPDKTYAFYRRWILISFPNTFDEKTCNPNILDEITSEDEISGLLNWSIEGLYRLLDKGDFSYNKTVEEVAEQYETLSDPIYAFVKEFLTTVVNGGILKDDLWEKYVNWCKTKKLSVTPKNMLTKELKKHLPELRDGKMGGKGNQRPAYRGISWKEQKNDEENENDEATPHTAPTGENTLW